jgi:hypothetical protein
MVSLWARKACCLSIYVHILAYRSVHACCRNLHAQLVCDCHPALCLCVVFPVCRRKSKQVEAQLLELGMEALEERLSSATQNPASPAYRLSRMISEVTQMEVRRGGVVWTLHFH